MAFLDKTDCVAINAKVKTDSKPRICMLTTRAFALNAFRCGFYEAQDVLLDIDEVDLIVLQPKKSYEFRKMLHEKLIWRNFNSKIVTTNMAIEPINLTQEYDLFIAYLPHLEDAIYIPAIKHWQRHCKTSICWVNELWVKNVQNPKFSAAWLSALDQFDHIAFGLDATARAVSDVLKRPCAFIPAGVDTLRFCPYPEPSARVIDIYSMGRVWPALHDSFLSLSAKNHLFYLYDTFNTGNTHVRDCHQHRDMFANIAKRAQYFVVAPAKMNSPNETADQIEIGARYFEAAAAGAILLGQSPKCEAFNKLFNWTDCVVEIQADGSDAAEVLASLANQPERLQAMSRRNTREALLRHDWMYRWQQILDITGLQPTEKLDQRKDKLKKMVLHTMKTS